MDNQRTPNDGGNLNNQGAPLIVPIIQATPISDVAVPLSANLTSSTINLHRG